MAYKKFTRANAADNYNHTLDQTYAAIDLLYPDKKSRDILKGLAVSISAVETSAGNYDLLKLKTGYDGVYQMNAAHAKMLRNSPDGLRLREILGSEEHKLPKDRDHTAQFLLDNGATAGVWTVSGTDPYANQGVLGALTTIDAAKRAMKASGKSLDQLVATDGWLPHNMGPNGGAAVLKAMVENPEQPLAEVRSDMGRAISPAAYNGNFTGSYAAAKAETVYNQTADKFYKKIAQGVTDKLRPHDRDLLMAVARPRQPEHSDPIDMRRIDVQQQLAIAQFKPKPTLGKDDVLAIQQELLASGYDLGKSRKHPDGVDGILGAKTKQAIADYNKATGRDVALYVKSPDYQAPVMLAANVPIPTARPDDVAVAADVPIPTARPDNVAVATNIPVPLDRPLDVSAVAAPKQAAQSNVTDYTNTTSDDLKPDARAKYPVMDTKEAGKPLHTPNLRKAEADIGKRQPG